MIERTSANGCRYQIHAEFTVVITPHAVERQYERSFNSASKINWHGLFNQLAFDNRNQYVTVDGFQCFLNKKWNSIRNRYEIEVISFTPNNWHKHNDVLIAAY